MRQAPKTLWAYAAISLSGALVYFVLDISDHPALALFTVAFALTFAVFLLLGSRVAWALVVATSAISLLTSPFATQPWWDIVIGIVSLACLLAPASWHFVWRPRPTLALNPTGQTTWDVDRHPDSDRPAGWYFAPDSPNRMRYWSPADARWLGSTIRTPRKVKRVSAARRAR